MKLYSSENLRGPSRRLYWIRKIKKSHRCSRLRHKKKARDIRMRDSNSRRMHFHSTCVCGKKKVRTQRKSGAKRAAIVCFHRYRCHVTFLQDSSFKKKKNNNNRTLTTTHMPSIWTQPPCAFAFCAEKRERNKRTHKSRHLSKRSTVRSPTQCRCSGVQRMASSKRRTK